MIRINCPFCGERDHSEFGYGGDASIVYPALDGSAEEWHDAVYLRENIRGVQFETWQHTNGCRMWLVVERDTMTHEIHSIRPAHDGNAGVLENTAESKPLDNKPAGKKPASKTSASKKHPAEGEKS